MRSRFKGFKFSLFLLLVIVALTSIMSWQTIAAPNGATTSPLTPERGTENNNPGNASAYAGNVTEVSLTGSSITQAWQGFYGNVSGAITLDDASGDTFYNWTLASPQGEVYASTNSSVTWGSIQCLNFTANGTEGGTGASETAGGTSQGGVNLTGLEARYGIADGDADGVNETFGFTISHDEFFTGTLNFTVGECPATAVFDSSGASVDGSFEEALLYEPATGSVVFAALLEQDLSGFDSVTHDFEMLVLEDGHDGNVAHTSYFFYVELS